MSKDWLEDDGKYIPHPATWLNAKGWEDEYGSATLQPDENTCKKCGSTDWQSLTGGLCEQCECHK